MERHFDIELKKLNGKLLKMSSLVENSISLSVSSLLNRKKELAEEVIASDKEIDTMEIEIDELCLKLLALYQPEAIDLRFITSVMRINSDLERIADISVNIAERSWHLIKKPPLKPLIDIPRMAKLVQDMVKDSIDALVNKDDKLALDVCKRDDEIDNLNDQIFRELLTYMIEDPETIKRAVGLIFVGKYLERIADHATNISEDVIYFVKGKTIKHRIEDRKN